MSKRRKKRSKENPKTAPCLSTLVRWLQRKLRHTQRTHFKHHLEIVRSCPSPVSTFSQRPCSEPVAKPEKAALESTSNGPTTRLRAVTSDGRVQSAKRKSSWDSPEETERDCKKPSPESSDNAEPSYYRRKRPKVQAKTNYINSKSDCGGNSSTESVSVLRSFKPTTASDSAAGPSQALDTAHEQLQTVTEESLSSEDSCTSKSLIGKNELEEVHEINDIDFQQKYQTTKYLKAGGYAMVYSGIRKEDNLPVAIKHVQACNSSRSRVMLNGTLTVVPLEVAMLIRVGAGPGEEESNVTPVLLDWYDLGTEIVMVLEKPEPCVDLVDYINGITFCITEQEAKVIFSQLVDAAKKMLALGVFHRDIKPDNVLIETGQTMPRARFIDFGCGTTFGSFDIFRTPPGTNIYAPPEYFIAHRYRPYSTTVWQLGLTLYTILNCRRPFATVETLCSSYQPQIRSDLSDECKDFLKRLMDKNPETRISLDNVKDHPWMN